MFIQFCEALGSFYYPEMKIMQNHNLFHCLYIWSYVLNVCGIRITIHTTLLTFIVWHIDIVLVDICQYIIPPGIGDILTFWFRRSICEYVFLQIYSSLNILTLIIDLYYQIQPYLIFQLHTLLKRTLQSLSEVRGVALGPRCCARNNMLHMLC